jgi:hypothetical protein
MIIGDWKSVAIDEVLHEFVCPGVLRPAINETRCSELFQAVHRVFGDQGGAYGGL